MPGFLAEALTWPSNYQYLVAVQTAYEMRLPPSAFIDETKDNFDWTPVDKKLVLAWNIMQRETCKQCGNPLWICRSTSNNLDFKVQTGICYATAKKAKWDDSARGKKLKPGEYGYVVPYLIDETKSMPTRRDWLAQLAEE